MDSEKSEQNAFHQPSAEISAPIDLPVPHSYQPLPLEGYLRTATIHPGAFDDGIVVSLQHVKFDEHNLPEYEALSYVWGSRENPQSIRVASTSGDHTTLSVTENLACALQHLRYADRPRTMWIDAICIDQSNNAEKGPQVAMMSEIYRRAPRVIAWLGPGRDRSDHAMEQLHSLGSQIEYDWDAGKLKPSATSTDPILADENEPVPFHSETFSSVYRLLCRTWFDRLWIRQEIYLANSGAVIMCGSYEIPWPFFRHALMGLHMKIPVPWDFPEENDLNDRMSYLSDLIFQPASISISALRDYFSNTVCDDPRDRIFGALGLFYDDEMALGIVPDYTKTVAQVYEDVVLRYLDRFGLEILRQCQHPGLGTQGPSWVPDWSKARNVWETITTTSASSQLKRWYQTPESGVLRVAGVSCAEISRVHPTHIRRTDTIQETFAKLQNIVPELDFDAPHFGGGSSFNAHVQTLICGGFGDYYYPARESYPDLNGGRAVMKMAMAASLTPLDPETQTQHLLEGNLATYTNSVRHCAEGRSLFTGAGGCVGYAPASAQPGDQIFVLLGCHSPMALRPLDNGRFLVLGECFVPGISHGEALLGPLPSTVQHSIIFLPGV